MAEPAPAPRSNTQVTVLVLLLLAGGSCCCLAAIGAGAAFYLSKTPAAEPTTVGAAGGTIEGSGVTVAIPPGAVASSTSVKIAPPRPAPPSTDKNLVVLGDLHRIELEGKLEADAELTLEYDPARLHGRRPEDVVALVLRERGYETVAPTRLDAAAHRITVKTRHFSDWTTGVPLAATTIAKSHPHLPFDVKVVDPYRAKLAPDFVEIVYRSVEKAYDTLTTRATTRPWMLPEPPHDEGKRLAIVVTDLASIQEQYKGTGGAAAVTVSDELILVQYDLLPVAPVWSDVVHEFVHAIQWRCVKRALALGQSPRWLSWTAEATAVFAAGVVVPPDTSGDIYPATPYFCYEELTYQSLTGPARPNASGHQYEAAAFIAYLVQRLGPKLLGNVLQDAYSGAASDVEALEAAIKETSHGKQKLFQVYREFVRDHEFTHRFGSRKLHDLAPSTLAPPADKIVALEPGKGDERSVELAGGAFMVPDAVRIPVTEDGLQLDLALEAPGPAWMWAIAGKTQLLGGDAKTLSLRLPPGVREVFVLPVSGAPQKLVLRAKLAETKEKKQVWVLRGGSPEVSKESYSHTNGIYGRAVDFTASGVRLHDSVTDPKRQDEEMIAVFSATSVPPSRLVEGDTFELGVEGKFEKVPRKGIPGDLVYGFSATLPVELTYQGWDKSYEGCHIDEDHAADIGAYHARVGHDRLGQKTISIFISLGEFPGISGGKSYLLATWHYDAAPPE